MTPAPDPMLPLGGLLTGIKLPDHFVPLTHGTGLDLATKVVLASMAERDRTRESLTSALEQAGLSVSWHDEDHATARPAAGSPLIAITLLEPPRHPDEVIERPGGLFRRTKPTKGPDPSPHATAPAASRVVVDLSLDAGAGAAPPTGGWPS